MTFPFFDLSDHQDRAQSTEHSMPGANSAAYRHNEQAITGHHDSCYDASHGFLKRIYSMLYYTVIQAGKTQENSWHKCRGKIGTKHHERDNPKKKLEAAERDWRC